MKSKATKKIQAFALIFTASIILASCYAPKLQWSDNTVELGLDHYVPHFLSEVKFFSESESGELTVMEECCIVENLQSPICYGTGGSGRFEMRHYGMNQGMGISYSIVYYFDGKEKKLIDSSGDSVFSDFALCDGDRLCYLVSDGTLRVLEKDGGRTDYENAFDSEKITLGYHLEKIKIYAEENIITIEQNGYLGSRNDTVVNDEPPVIRSSAEIDNPGETPDSLSRELQWSIETCPAFAAEKINEIPRYIDQYKKTQAYSQTHTYNGELYYRGGNTIAEGGYIVLDGVKCYSTGENEGYAVKSYKYKCDEEPLFFEIYRFENGKLKLLDFSADSKFANCFACNCKSLCYYVDGSFFRFLEKDGSRTEIYWKPKGL